MFSDGIFLELHHIAFHGKNPGNHKDTRSGCRLFYPVHRNECRFSEREGWHLGRATPRPHTRFQALAAPAGAMPRGGRCRDGWHRPATRGRALALAAPFPALLAVSSGHRGRPPCRLRLSQWAASVAILHQWDTGQVVACSVCSVVACSVLLQITPTP